MSKNIAYERIVLKRTDVAGRVPTKPVSPKDPNDHTTNFGTVSGWTSTDIYAGEMYVNLVDEKVWIGMESGPKLLQFSGSTSSFLNLSDTPDTYTGKDGLYVIVNSATTALEFTSAPTYNFQDLENVGALQANKYLQVNSSATQIEYVDINTNFTGLDDTPSAYTYSGYTLVVNSAKTGLEYYSLLDNYVSLSTNQTISGSKTFTNKPTFSTGFTFLSNDINNFSTNSSLTDASDDTISSSLAIKNYIDNSTVLSAYTNLVYTNQDQEIDSIKTFLQDIKLQSSDIQLLGGDLYFGVEGADGVFKIENNAENKIEVNKYDSSLSSYTFIADFDDGFTTTQFGFKTGRTDTPDVIITGITSNSALTLNPYRVVTEDAIKRYVDSMAGGGSAANDKEVLFNNSGAFDGNSNFIYDYDYNRLTIGTRSASTCLSETSLSVGINNFTDSDYSIITGENNSIQLSGGCNVVSGCFILGGEDNMII